MKKNFFALGFCALALGLAACGDDGSSNSEPNVVKGELLALADGSGEKLCDEKLEGWVAESIDKDFRRCLDGEWTKITASEASAENEIIGGVTELHGLSSTTEESSSSTKDSAPAEGSSSSALTTSSSSAPTEDFVSSSSSSRESLKVDHGTMTDSRDGRVYKTVTIGSQTWMAENLNYKYNRGTAKSFCYDNSTTNCSKYGLLYLWSAAMDSVGAFSTAGKGCGNGKTCSANGTVRGVCPEGWHLPSDDEWNYLWTAIGGTSSAGTKLKSTSGWYNDGNGIDSFDFTVLSAGYYDGNLNKDADRFNGKGMYAYFWSSSENDGSYAYHWYFGFDRGHVRHYNFDKNSALSVRCLRNSNDEGNGATSSSSSSVASDPESLSSAAIEEKSSSSVDKPNWRYLNPDIDYGEFTDIRDGQIYKSVKIGSQIWMAENLNYAPKNVSSMDEDAWCGCYDNENANCSLYGRLYTWKVAMNNADCAGGNECNPSGTIQGVCPSGWHLPSKEEWQELLEPLATSIDSNEDGEAEYNGAGVVLESVEGWRSGSPEMNSTGFSALSGGFYICDDDFTHNGFGVGFLTSSGEEGYYYVSLNGTSNTVHLYYTDFSVAYSVRCVQD